MRRCRQRRARNSRELPLSAQGYRSRPIEVTGFATAQGANIDKPCKLALTGTCTSFRLLAKKTLRPMNDSRDTHDLARQLLAGQLDESQFLQALRARTFAPLEHTNLDLDRKRRTGFPEVIFGEGKSDEALISIVQRLQQDGQSVLVTRLGPDPADALQAVCPNLQYNKIARTLRSVTDDGSTVGCVAVVTAGTGDASVAEEACETLRWMGVAVEVIRDVGVAGPHRLPAHLEKLARADAIVVVAGMEGALPSVVGGYVAAPVIAVPTGVGYGANFSGLSALLSMLNSCAANVAVVNIDAGFKGGYVAGLIARSRNAE